MVSSTPSKSGEMGGQSRRFISNDPEDQWLKDAAGRIETADAKWHSIKNKNPATLLVCPSQRGGLIETDSTGIPRFFNGVTLMNNIQKDEAGRG